MLSNKDSVAIVILYSGEKQEIKRIVNYIKQKEGTVIAVSSISDSYLRKNADYIMDIIFSLLFKNNYNINLIEKLERAKNIQNIEFLKNQNNDFLLVNLTRRNVVFLFT